MSLESFRRARADAKRGAALAAASALFQRAGFERASMEAVAKEAGISTATLYRHFATKEILFEAVALSALDGLAPPPAGRGDAKSRLRSIAVRYAELLAAPATRGFMRMIIAETGRNPRLAELFYARVKTRLGAGFVGVYRDGVDAGFFKRAADPDQAVGQLQGMIEHAALMRGLVLGDDAPPTMAAKDIAASALETWLARWARPNRKDRLQERSGGVRAPARARS